MKQIFRGLGALLCEARYALMQLKRDRTAAQTSAILRTLLRQIPWWRRGHLALAWTELQGAEREPGKKDPRALHTAEVSACAVERLAVAGLPDRATLEARYIKAMTQFHRGCYAEALVGLQEVLEPEKARVIDLRVHLLALENAGAALLALGREKEAANFFLKIPPGRRTNEVKAALGMIASPERLG